MRLHPLHTYEIVLKLEVLFADGVDIEVPAATILSMFGFHAQVSPSPRSLPLVQLTDLRIPPRHFGSPTYPFSRSSLPPSPFFLTSPSSSSFAKSGNRVTYRLYILYSQARISIRFIV